MITSDIFEIFSQIIVGAYTLYAVFFTVWLFSFRKTKFVTWLKQYINSFCVKKSGNHTKGVLVTIFFMSAFGIGLFIHSVVDDLVDANPRINWIGFGIEDITGSETGYRFSSIYSRTRDEKTGEIIKRRGNYQCSKSDQLLDNGECDPCASYELSSLGKEILKDKSVIFHHVDFGDEHHNEFLSDPNTFLSIQTGGQRSETKCKVATHFTRKIFYDADYFSNEIDYAKNKINRWETEINFMGGMLLISIILLFSLSTFLAYLLFKSLYIGENKLLSHSYLKQMFLVLIPSVILMSYGYSVSMRSYTEKIVGTYASGINLNDVDFKNIVQSNDQNPKLNATKWLNDSREYAFISKRIYKYAYLDIKDKLDNCTKLTCSVIMDLDETVLSNAQYELILRKNSIKHDNVLMDRWWRENIKEKNVPLVPGAKQFIDDVQDNVKIIYITARDESRRDITVEILEAAEIFADEVIYFSGDQDKKDTRDSIKPFYGTVLAYFGDQVGDVGLKSKKEKDASNENECLNCYLLPNPIYGDWIENTH